VAAEERNRSKVGFVVVVSRLFEATVNGRLTAFLKLFLKLTGTGTHLPSTSEEGRRAKEVVAHLVIFFF